MASKRRNMFYQNKKQETTEIASEFVYLCSGRSLHLLLMRDSFVHLALTSSASRIRGRYPSAGYGLELQLCQRDFKPPYPSYTESSIGRIIFTRKKIRRSKGRLSEFSLLVKWVSPISHGPVPPSHCGSIIRIANFVDAKFSTTYVAVYGCIRSYAKSYFLKRLETPDWTKSRGVGVPNKIGGSTGRREEATDEKTCTISHVAVMSDEEAFANTKFIMRCGGILKAEGRFYWAFVLCRTLFAVTLAYVLTALAINMSLEKSDHVTIMEAVLYGVGIFHIACKYVVLQIRRSEIVATIRQLEVLASAASRNDPECRRSLLEVTRFLDLVLKVYLCACFLVASVSFTYGLYSGKPPYPAIWLPMGNIQAKCALQVVTLVPPVAYLGITYSLLMSFTAHVTVHMAYLCRQLENFTTRGVEKTKLSRCIQLHQIILNLCRRINDIFGDLLFQEIVLSSIQCCVSAYLCSQQIKILAAGNSVFCLDMIFTLLMPLLICSCGERIKAMSNKIAFAAYCSEWYTRSEKDKRSVMVLITAASRPLKLHYKNLFCFDFAQYAIVLHTAYSYFTVLRSLDLL
ncbi:hypothetical protein AAG570_006468 [Ranatra chinensis]|uniref:Odorant receptor n=1 Tax=Ranatra chinensis TaxID=642074 RepID=A0ABD0ZHA9_9HEMI